MVCVSTNRQVSMMFVISKSMIVELICLLIMEQKSCPLLHFIVVRRMLVCVKECVVVPSLNIHPPSWTSPQCVCLIYC